MIVLPEILNQGNLGSCVSYGLSGLANYYLQQKGINDTINPMLLFQATERNDGANARTVLNYCKDVGMPGKSGNIYRMREFQSIAQSISQMESACNQHGGFVFAYSMHDGDPFRRRLTTDFVLSRAPSDLHFMVACGPVLGKSRFRVANSWGENFGDHGYFEIPYTLMRSEFVKQCFWFSII